MALLFRIRRARHLFLLSENLFINSGAFSFDVVCVCVFVSIIVMIITVSYEVLIDDTTIDSAALLFVCEMFVHFVVVVIVPLYTTTLCYSLCLQYARTHASHELSHTTTTMHIIPSSRNAPFCMCLVFVFIPSVPFIYLFLRFIVDEKFWTDMKNVYAFKNVVTHTRDQFNLYLLKIVHFSSDFA